MYWSHRSCVMSARAVVQSPDGVAVIPQVRHVLSLLGLIGVDRIANRPAHDFDASALLCHGFERALSCQLDRCSEVIGLQAFADPR